MSHINNFNNSPAIFRAAKESYARRGIKLVVTDAYVIAGSDGIVAMFDSNEDAYACLLAAGYVEESAGVEQLPNLGARYRRTFSWGEPPDANKEGMQRLEKKYGPDFLKKLPLYSTARYRGEPVLLLTVSVVTLSAQIRTRLGALLTCRLVELDDFVL